MRAIQDIWNSFIDILNSFQDILKWIKDILKSFQDILNSIPDILNSFQDIFKCQLNTKAARWIQDIFKDRLNTKKARCYILNSYWIVNMCYYVIDAPSALKTLQVIWMYNRNQWDLRICDVIQDIYKCLNILRLSLVEIPV